MTERLAVGDVAPWFKTQTPTNPNYYFNTTAGHYVLLAFMPADPSVHAERLAHFRAHRSRFDDVKLSAFFVLTDEASISTAKDRLPGVRFFLDRDRAISRLYGALDGTGAHHPHWLLLDPSLRAMASAPMDDSGAFFASLADLPALEDYAGVPLQAPVLIVPRVFEPEICARLVATYQAHGGDPSGVMRDVDGRTVGILDDFKKRRDVMIEDEDFRKGLRLRITRRLLPEIAKAFQFEATRLERYLVACYDAADGGYFRPHRDNETFATAHRRFAVSINLNAEEFEGGDLRFPEFGPRTYRPPTGGAVVFCCSLQHEATPVTRGRRYAFLPFIYDDEGARIREANLSRLAPPDQA